MLEIPEAAVISKQLNETISGKTIQSVIVGQSPHSFAWYSDVPEAYAASLNAKTIQHSVNLGGMVEIFTEDSCLLFSDGINLRYHSSIEDQPAKHQLLITFTDNSILSASVAMYGGLVCYPIGEYENKYYLVAKEKPSPLTDEFDMNAFLSLFEPGLEKKSLKAFLATEQRIPGFGNGVLQDILYLAGLHPKRKVSSLQNSQKEVLFHTIKETLQTMTDNNGRDTERDLFGSPGKYLTLMSKNTKGKPCQKCGSIIQKQSYMGGSIYVCPQCQTI
ncbi:MAG: hypothetical protein JEZ00_10880 [Anaerolineaceae bacterium]|nr:hypothetical protein [Anaerolineaceae bacterium]